jgi:hypothetical protein
MVIEPLAFLFELLYKMKMLSDYSTCIVLARSYPVRSACSSLTWGSTSLSHPSRLPPRHWDDQRHVTAGQIHTNSTQRFFRQLHLLREGAHDFFI